MYVCDNCGRRLSCRQETESRRPFPAFSVAGAAAGLLGAAATGSILLIPAALVLGVAADVRRCGLCGAEDQENEGGFHLMDERPDDLGGQVYRPVERPSPSAGREPGPSPTSSTPPRPISRPAEPLSQFARTNPLETPRPPAPGQEQDEFRFDELERALVRQEPPPVPAGFDMDVSPPEALDVVGPDLPSLSDDGGAVDLFPGLDDGWVFELGEETPLDNVLPEEPLP